MLNLIEKNLTLLSLLSPIIGLIDALVIFSSEKEISYSSPGDDLLYLTLGVISFFCAAALFLSLTSAEHFRRNDQYIPYDQGHPVSVIYMVECTPQRYRQILFLCIILVILPCTLIYKGAENLIFIIAPLLLVIVLIFLYIYSFRKAMHTPGLNKKFNLLCISLVIIYSFVMYYAVEIFMINGFHRTVINSGHMPRRWVEFQDGIFILSSLTSNLKDGKVWTDFFLPIHISALTIVLFSKAYLMRKDEVYYYEIGPFELLGSLLIYAGSIYALLSWNNISIVFSVEDWSYPAKFIGMYLTLSLTMYYFLQDGWKRIQR